MLHLTASDAEMLQSLHAVCSMPESKYLLEQIMQRRPYPTLLDLRPSVKDSVAQRKVLERSILPVQEMLYTKGPVPAPDRFAYAEKVRKAVQEKLRASYEPRRGVSQNQMEGAPSNVAVLLDVPNTAKFAQTTVNVADDIRDDCVEVDVGISGGRPQDRWMNSVVPRLYKNPLFRLKPVKVDIVKAVADGVTSIH